MAKQDVRLVEAPYFDRMKRGDDSAKWELYALYEKMIFNSARLFSRGDPMLEEELLMESDRAFTDALATYKKKGERYYSFSTWLYWYLGNTFKPIVKDRNNQKTGGNWVDYNDLPDDFDEYEDIVQAQRTARQHGSESGDQAIIESLPEPESMNGRMADGVPFYHSSEPINLSDGLPTFLNEKTAQVAHLLSRGFGPGEVKAMVGLSEGEYRKKCSVIAKKLEMQREER